MVLIVLLILAIVLIVALILVIILILLVLVVVLILTVVLLVLIIKRHFILPFLFGTAFTIPQIIVIYTAVYLLYLAVSVFLFCLTL